MSLLRTTEWFWIDHREGTGIYQMALDEALLQWVQAVAKTPLILARTYRWSSPTLSLGTHQKEQSALQAYKAYSGEKKIDIVRRPTGGRAILHGEDISFAFVTNIPELLGMSLGESYCFFTTWIRQALEQLGIPLQQTCDAGERDYLHSPLCFETRTPSDLISSENGRKVAGSAQLRRHGGILQHGAAFLKPFHIPAKLFDRALRQIIETRLDSPPILWDPEQDELFLAQFQCLQKRYAEEAEQIAVRLSTTTGSHLLPASD